MLAAVECLLEREVHHGLEIASLFPLSTIILPRSGIGGYGDPGLAHGVEVGIFLAEFLHPLGHRFGKGVGIGIHADAIDAGGLYPPLGVLNEIAHQVGVVLIQVGHRRDEPTLNGLTLIDSRGVGV